MLFRPEGYEENLVIDANKAQRRPKILIIDDDEDILEILKQQLYFAGYETVQATNAEIGYEILMENCPDGVVLDIFLPGMDGWALTKKIRETEKLAHLPVVLGTGFYTGAEAKAKALEYGIDAFVVKPYDNDVLLNILNDMVERYFGLTPIPPHIVEEEEIVDKNDNSSPGENEGETVSDKEQSPSV